MNKIALFITFALTIASCKEDTKPTGQNEQETDISNKVLPTGEDRITTAQLDWDSVPDLDNIGNFPFFTAPTGLKINDEKEGLSELFAFEKMENFTGNGTYTTEGKLGILSFAGNDGDFNQRLFDKSFYDYLEKIGAKKIYKGEYPTSGANNEGVRKKLKENLWSGKHRTSGLLDESGSPFGVYAFKNNGKKYILNIQSNSAQGTILLMELQDFVQTVTKYSAAQMKKDIDANGKAILNINFDTDKATLQPDGQKIVDEIVSLMKQNPTLKLSIEGHTDNTGSAEKNKKLSTERANTVLSSLTKNGIETSKLKAVGLGAEKPMVANDTEENKAKNRRVELVKF